VARGRVYYLKPCLYYTLHNKTTIEYQIIAKPSHSQAQLKNAHNSQQLRSEGAKFAHFQITILVHNCHYLKQCCFKHPCIRGHTKLHCIEVLMFLPLLIWSMWHNKCWRRKSRKECIIIWPSLRTEWRGVEMAKNNYVQFLLSCWWPWIRYCTILWASVLLTQVLGTTHTSFLICNTILLTNHKELRAHYYICISNELMFTLDEESSFKCLWLIPQEILF